MAEAVADEIVALNLATGATRVIGQVPGASGPLTRDGMGVLVYATAPLTFPPPPGAVQVLRWFETQVLAALNAGPEGGILGAANGQPLALGLDSAGDIAMDTDGDFYFVDYGTNEVRVIAEIGRSPPGVSSSSRRSPLIFTKRTPAACPPLTPKASRPEAPRIWRCSSACCGWSSSPG